MLWCFIERDDTKPLTHLAFLYRRMFRLGCKTFVPLVRDQEYRVSNTVRNLIESPWELHGLNMRSKIESNSWDSVTTISASSISVFTCFHTFVLIMHFKTQHSTTPKSCYQWYTWWVSHVADLRFIATNIFDSRLHHVPISSVLTFQNLHKASTTATSTWACWKYSGTWLDVKLGKVPSPPCSIKCASRSTRQLAFSRTDSTRLSHQSWVPSVLAVRSSRVFS